MNILKLFWHVDDFYQSLVTRENAKLLGVARKRGPAPSLSLSEVMPVLIHFHQSHYRDFKAYDTQHVCKHMRSEFPALVSYTRFVELNSSALPAMCLYLRVRFGQRTGVAFIDSTPLSVCRNNRIGRHRVFAEVARRGKSSMGWFYGFKLHLIVNDQGELLAVQLKMTKKLWGKLVGDRGYLSQVLYEQRFAQGLQLMAADRPLPITPIRRTMQNRLVVLEKKLLTRKRFVIGTIVDQLRNISQIEHSRNRSTTNFVVTLIAGLIAYTWQAKKPFLDLSQNEMALLPALI